MQEIQVHKLDTYPIVKHYIEELGIAELFEQHLKDAKPIHNASLCVLLTNIIVSVRPLYKISNWLGAYSDGQSEFGYEANVFNDDRLGESLDILYKSNRHCLMSEVSIKAIKQHDLQTEELHNDTTTVSLSGAYDRSIKPGGVTPLRGYNKDGRPDAKQIVFGLTTTSDGHVPVLAQWYDGNISDTNTHQPNWWTIPKKLDSKLSYENHLNLLI